MGFMGAAFGGGVDPGAVNKAGSALLNLGTTATTGMGQQQKLADVAGAGATGYWKNLMYQGSPWLKPATDYGAGTVAQSYAPQFGGVYRATSTMGTNTPSGYRDALINNLRASQGTAFDNSLVQAMIANQQAKSQGAAGVQGEQQIAQNAAQQYGQLGAGTEQAILNAPQRGGIIPALAGAAAGVGSTMTGMGMMKNAGFFGA